jgi:adenosine deaminase
MLRDMSAESAMEHYEAALPYRDMIVGIGLDSDEYLRPPSLFEAVFARARADGFHLTCHCDVGQYDTHENIRQVASTVGGTGAERIDHGLNAAQKPELINLIREKGLGMTICPWAYFRHEPVDEIFPRIRTLYEAGLKITIASDDPAYMEDCWILHNMLLTKSRCGFSDMDMAKLVENAVDMCWAPEELKKSILEEIEKVEKSEFERDAGAVPVSRTSGVPIDWQTTSEMKT